MFEKQSEDKKSETGKSDVNLFKPLEIKLLVTSDITENTLIFENILLVFGTQINQFLTKLWRGLHYFNYRISFAQSWGIN